MCSAQKVTTEKKEIQGYAMAIVRTLFQGVFNDMSNMQFTLGGQEKIPYQGFIKALRREFPFLNQIIQRVFRQKLLGSAKKRQYDPIRIDGQSILLNNTICNVISFAKPSVDTFNPGQK